MSYVRETKNPKLEEGEVVEAEIVDIEYPVQSPYGEQIEIYARLGNGHEARVWIPYYKRPSDRSHLGQLCIKVMERLGEEHETVDETLNALVSRIGKIFVRCHGFREYQGVKYPRLKIVPDKLPSFQGRIERIEDKCKNCGETIPLDSKFCPECGTSLL